MTIKLSKKQKIQILNGNDLFMVMKEILLRESKIDRNKEHLWVVSLSISNQLLLIELIALGSVRDVQIEPMEIFSFALQKRAVKIIIVHNHPSGSLKPSQRDIEMTDKIQAIGDFLRVPLIDHLIISEKEYFSFDESGLLVELIRKGNYDLTFNTKDKLLTTIKRLQKELHKSKNTKPK